MSATNLACLTPRQVEFLALTAQGKRYSTIAEECFVEVGTVQVILAQAKERLDAVNLPQAVVKALARDLLQIDSFGNVSVVTEDSVIPQ